MTVSKNPNDIKNMFNEIASQYDKNNNFISLGLHKFVKKTALKHLSIKNNDRILDECTGTGDIAAIIREINPQNDIVGVDFSENMINIAKNKYPNITFLQADCTDLPFSNNSFDIITMSFGLRNIENYIKAIRESFRVLSDGGQFLHLDFGRKNFFSKVFDFVAEKSISIFYKNQIPYKYLVSSKREFFTPENLIKEFEKEGFTLICRQDYLFGIISMQIFEKSKTAYC